MNHQIKRIALSIVFGAIVIIGTAILFSIKDVEGNYIGSKHLKEIAESKAHVCFISVLGGLIILVKLNFKFIR